jgi:hypothetical protein
MQKGSLCFDVWDLCHPNTSKFSHRTKGWTLKKRKISITSCVGALMDLTVPRYLETLRKARPDLADKVHYTQKRGSRPEWHPKPTRADAKTSADAHMVFVLPVEFHAQGRQELLVA